MLLPALVLMIITALFLVMERVRPGRALEPVHGWYTRALAMTGVQFGITLATAGLWAQIFGTASLFHLRTWHAPLAEGFTAWFVGTFLFYWWHRLRHQNGFWLLFHQLHHSPSRIEVLTSFYKHPVEIFADAVLSALILYPLLGCSLEGAVWCNIFAATGEYFYHANIRTPKWLRLVIQTPELHSVHHQLDVHTCNFGDLPVWDRLFGTYRDSVEFAGTCGFPAGAEQKLLPMLVFRDVYKTWPSGQ